MALRRVGCNVAPWTVRAQHWQRYTATVWTVLYRRFGKRALDLVLAVLGLLVLWPLLAVVAFLTRWKMGSPVLYRQTRPGFRGAPFTIYKFRTMRDLHDEQGRPLPDGRRLTPFGRWLRATSLDELPELFNLLRGDMSVVGPRPLLMQYIERYTPEQARRQDARPGITGLAQVSGRNLVSWEERFRLDVFYVDHYGPWLDCKILFQTVRMVFSREGITAAGHVSMPEFMGSGNNDDAGGTATETG